MILNGEIKDRPNYDPKKLLESCCSVTALASRSLLSLAKLRIEEHDTESWIQAAHDIQNSYALITKERDIWQIESDCTELARLVATRLRERVQANRADPALMMNDLIACGLFDSNGVPIANKALFMREINELFGKAMEGDLKVCSQLGDLLIRRGNIRLEGPSKASKALLPQIAKARSAKVGRNTKCLCGSHKKFKFCCGSG